MNSCFLYEPQGVCVVGGTSMGENFLQTSSLHLQAPSDCISNICPSECLSPAALLLSSILLMCSVFFTCWVCRGHKYFNMQKMCSKRSMSFWTALPLPCQPCLTDLGQGPTSAYVTEKRVLLSQEMSLWATCHQPQLRGDTPTTTRAGDSRWFLLLSPRFTNSFQDAFVKYVPRSAHNFM